MLIIKFLKHYINNNKHLEIKELSCNPNQNPIKTLDCVTLETFSH